MSSLIVNCIDWEHASIDLPFTIRMISIWLINENVCSMTSINDLVEKRLVYVDELLDDDV